VLRRVPASDPDRLVAISTTDPQTAQQGFIYADAFTAFRAEQRSFAALSMYQGGYYPRIDVRGATTYVGLEGITSEYFALTGAQLAAGRLLAEEDAAPASVATPAVVITDRLWQRMFGGDARAVGETLKIDGTPATVVGVIAPGFYGLQADAGSDIFLSLPAYDTAPGSSDRNCTAWHPTIRG
jgi:hypothetical protein